VRFWDLRVGNCIETLRGHRDDITGVGVDADQTTMYR